MKKQPKGWLYTLRGMESYSPTQLPHCIALGWHETPLYEHPPQDERYELPGHEETMDGINSLTIPRI